MKRLALSVILLAVFISGIMCIRSGGDAVQGKADPSGPADNPTPEPVMFSPEDFSNTNPLPRLECEYFDENGFYASISLLDTAPADTGRTITGGIVTHHLLASELMAQFFNAVSSQRPETVIVIGPNHKRFGQSPIHTGKWGWNTPFGTLEADCEAVGGIIDELGAYEDYDLLAREHSISSLVPYISYFLPDAKIVPILLHGNMGIDRCAMLADHLHRLFKEKKCLVVASIDFSHYLTPEEAYGMDEATIRAIGARDYETIMKMGNDNLDTPPTLVTVLMLMDKLGAEEELIAHRNSSDIAGIWSDSTTSYLTYIFGDVSEAQ